MSGWPFVGRTEELVEGLTALRADSGLRGVALCGEAGVGKTTLGRVMAETIESEGLNARFVLGTETGQAVPLGAFQRTVAIEAAHEPAVMRVPRTARWRPTTAWSSLSTTPTSSTHCRRCWSSSWR